MKLLHLADLHLDAPMKGLGEWAPSIASRLMRGTFEALTRAIDFAIAERVDGVLFAGDLFDRCDRSLRARLHVQRELGRLDERAIPSFVVHGNHDPLSASLMMGYPPSTTVFGVAWSEVCVAGGRYRVQGMSFGRAEVDENLSLSFRRTSDVPTIGLLHANVGGAVGHANYAPCSLGDLARAQLDYWALGHVHTRAVFEVGAGLAAYPGNLQGRHVRETGPRGGLLVEIDDMRAVRPRVTFVPFDVVRWLVVTIDVTNITMLDAFFSAAVGEADAAIGVEPAIETHIIRVCVRGATPLHHEFLRNESRAAIEERVAANFEARGWLLESVVFETVGQIDVRSLVAAGGFVGELARLLDEPPSDEGLAQLWATAQLDELDQQLRIAQLESLDRRAAFRAAVALALERLLEARA